MVNKVLLIGNLGRDPEVRRLENGSVVAKFSVATNENYKDKSGEWQSQTEWHDIVVWQQLAEKAEKSLSKGATVWIEGKLTHRTWEDKDGNNRKTTEVVASYFRVVSKRTEVEEVGPYAGGSISAPTEPIPQSVVDGDDSDLPF